MAKLELTIHPMETDFYGYVAPETLIRLAVDVSDMQSDEDGLPGNKLYEELGAVWMLAKLQLKQFAPIVSGDHITVTITPRAIEGVRYLRVADFLRGGERVAECACVFIPVLFDERSIVRPDQVEALYAARPDSELRVRVGRVRVPANAAVTYEDTVRDSDCDSNRHFSSPKYAAMICDALGFWRGGEGIMKRLQIDFHNECRAGEKLFMHTAEQDGVKYILGKDSQDRQIFAAACEF